MRIFTEATTVPWNLSSNKKRLLCVFFRRGIMKKAIIPILVFVLLAGLGFLIVYLNGADKRFSVPGRSEHEKRITELGYQVGELDQKTLKKLGIEPFTEIYAVTDLKDKKANLNMDVNYVYRDCNNTEDAVRMMSDLYAYAQYLKGSGDASGKIKLVSDAKKGKACILYDVSVPDSFLLSDFALRASSGNLFSDKETISYLYGGTYLDGTRVVSITTTNGLKSREIEKILKEMKLPTP